MTDKPSRNEDEYFARREAEMLKRRKETAEQAASLAERRSHYMKCPKCGADLKAERYHGIEVDRCLECHGIWMDQEEAETLLAKDTEGVAGFIRSVAKGVKISKK